MSAATTGPNADLPTAPTELERFARSLYRSHESPYGDDLELLMAGIRLERERLKNRLYLVIVDVHIFNYDGMFESFFIDDSFRCQHDAEVATRALMEDLAFNLILPQHKLRHRWGVESYGAAPWLAVPGERTAVRTLFDRSVKLRAGPFDTVYFCVRTVGPLPPPTLDTPLATFCKCRPEFRRYLIDVGRAAKEGKPRPQVVDLPKEPDWV